MREYATYMREERSYILKDFSSILASLLPILQLLLIRIPEAVAVIFLQPEYFTSISIITLVMSYVFIIAYQTTPYLHITLPFQKDRVAKFNEYVRLTNEASSAKNFVAGEQATVVKIDMFLEGLKKPKPVKQPVRITQDNIVLICVVTITLNALSFIILGQLSNDSLVYSITQSLNYVLLITATALILTVYRRNDLANKKNEHNQRERTNKAIKLARDSNCFGNLPQVKLISSFQDNDLPSNYHVWVEHKGQKYEIITDYNAIKIVAVYPFS